MPEQKDHAEIRKAIASLPSGTKEKDAWDKLGEGKKIPRHEFRDLWLEIRVPTTKKPEAAPEVTSDEAKK